MDLQFPAGDVIDVRLRNGVRLHARAFGDPDAPVTILLLHGWTLDHRIWHRQLAEIPAGLPTPARVIVYDARGHGRSSTSPRRSKTLAQLGDDLADLLTEAVPTGPVVLVGHSLGGMTIMEYAHRHPDDFAERVAGLVMIATTAEGHIHTEYGLPTRLGHLIRLAEISGAYILARCGAWRPHRMLQHVLRPSLRWLLFGDHADRQDVRLTTATVARTTLRAIGGFRPSIGAQRRLETLAALARIPAAVLVGDRDRLTPAKCAESIAAALGGAEVIALSGAGHMLMLERADEVNAAIARVVEEAVAAKPPTDTDTDLPLAA
ncbi:MAG TPA: alpha/beta hydrolase [Pilimelia sp.]|nr:alpha/beta hydrolase [Pilimelia sp.]